MQLSSPRSSFHFITWLIFSMTMRLMLFSASSSDDPRTSEAGLFCGQAKPPPNSSYIPLFVKEMQMVSQQVTANGWGHYATNESQISIYALAQCYEDLSHTDCLLCYATSRTRLPRCLPAMSARIYLDGCFLRYDNYNFYNESIDPITDSFNCSSSIGKVSDSEVASFGKVVTELVDKVSIASVMNGGYAVRGQNGVYGLAQCWETLSKEGCRECLAKASRNVKRCVPSREGRGLNAGCYLRYSTQKFYNHNPQNLNNSSGPSKRGKVVAIVAGIGAFSLLCIFAACAIHTRLKKYKQERRNLGQISSLYKKSNLNFRYETLEKATDFFDPSRKIGQGGAGTVYKGTLPEGKSVAVKRLFFNTRQWVDEFFNEVNLISGIQHKNLVKLLGCSIEGPESLLVYEFASNGSLDQFLSDKNGKKILNWKERFEIILGTAEGIAFLHGGAKIRIIHRDIKSSNVLLDENFAPKVADFGLVRCFGENITHLSTGIAGTLGYMAPEYLVKGQLTEKADVFSFGVLVFEIICGRKNTVFLEGNGSLTHNVWKLYKMDKLTESVDTRLKGDFPENEASKVLQIGLLCTQASAALRPSMEEVVQMLKKKGSNIQEPYQPPFLNAGLLSVGTTTMSYTCSIKSSTTSTSNTINKQEASSYSNELSSTQSSDASAS